MFTESLFEQWYQSGESTEKMDSCYEIFDILGFIRAVSKKIAWSAKFDNCASVDYLPEKIDYRTPQAYIHPALGKQADKYQWQYEHRMLWSARQPSPPLQPWIIHVPQARQFCRPLAFRAVDGIFSYSDLR